MSPILHKYKSLIVALSAAGIIVGILRSQPESIIIAVAVLSAWIGVVLWLFWPEIKKLWRK